MKLINFTLKGTCNAMNQQAIALCEFQCALGTTLPILHLFLPIHTCNICPDSGTLTGKPKYVKSYKFLLGSCRLWRGCFQLNGKLDICWSDWNDCSPKRNKTLLPETRSTRLAFSTRANGMDNHVWCNLVTSWAGKLFTIAGLITCGILQVGCKNSKFYFVMNIQPITHVCFAVIFYFSSTHMQ